MTRNKIDKKQLIIGDTILYNKRYIEKSSTDLTITGE